MVVSPRRPPNTDFGAEASRLAGVSSRWDRSVLRGRAQLHAAGIGQARWIEGVRRCSRRGESAAPALL